MIMCDQKSMEIVSRVPQIERLISERLIDCNEKKNKTH